MTFEQLGLSAPLLRAVSSQGYTSPTPIQSQAIPHVLAGADVLGCAQTGTGKTAAFALPILHRLTHAGGLQRERGRRIRVLVLSPTRELAAQIADSFRVYGRETGLRHTVVFGGVSQRPQVRDLQRGVDILVATPGRLVDLMSQGLIDLGSVEVFVLDEADRMLDMGFLPDLRRIQCKLPRQRQTLFFSATMPESIRDLADSLLRNPARIQVAPVQATTALIAESVCFVPKQGKPQLLADLLAAPAVARALVFTRTKHGADRVARQLNKVGIRAEAMHGNKSQNSRQRTLAGFKSNRPPVLVATDVAARGIDVEGVSHVFNYDLPHEPEMYVHRIGRTGRAGASGIAVSFCDHNERKLLQAIERLIRRKLSVERGARKSL
jgi:ATP-dependent RNA helicase RhlE